MPALKRDPPRWFAPAVFVGMLVASAALVGLAALLFQQGHHGVDISGRTYLVPPSEVSSLTQEPYLFIRIKPSDQPFEIVYDARASGKRDATGVPHIFSVNDHAQHDIWYARDEGSVIVCRRASSPSGGCGTWISYGGVTWSVLFPEARIADGDSFAARATTQLKKYDANVSSLLP